MTKNLKISAFLLFLMSSCLTNENGESNEVIKIDSSAANLALDIESEKQTITDEEMIKKSNLKIVSPNDLKVDGYQRYFLNDTLFTGISRELSDTSLLFEIQFLNGRKHGFSTFWHKNGQKKTLLNFENGIAKGKFKIWDKNGNLLREGIN